MKPAPWLRDQDDPEDFYDYVGEWRRQQKTNRVIAWIVLGAVLGLIVGVFVLLFGAV